MIDMDYNLRDLCVGRKNYLGPAGFVDVIYGGVVDARRCFIELGLGHGCNYIVTIHLCL